MSITTLPIPHWLNTTLVPFNPLPELNRNVTSNGTVFMICAVIKNEELYIDEWLEYHKFLGFDYAMLFDNADNRTEYTMDLPNKYPGYVTLHHGPGLKQQDVNYMKCVHTFQNTSTWAAFIDVDEFMVLHEHNTIREYVQDVAPFGGSIAINRAQYTSSNQLNYTAYPVLYRFQTRHVVPDARVKSIAYIPHIESTDTHHVRLLNHLPIVDAAGQFPAPAQLKNNGILKGSTDVAVINHYFTKSYEEFKLKRQRGLAGHSERNGLYEGEDGKLKIKSEFLHQHTSRAQRDSSAWDWYRAKKSEQLGYGYGADFPVLNFTAALLHQGLSIDRLTSSVISLQRSGTFTSLHTVQKFLLSAIHTLMSIATLPIPTWLRTTFVPFNPLPTLDTKVTTDATKFMICAVVKDEELYIDEWLEYHKFLGFDYVMLIDNADNMTEYTMDLPNKYPGYVTLHHGPGLKKQDVNYMKCVNTFQNTSAWAAFIDVDEFIVLYKHKNIREYVQDVAPMGGSIAINRAEFTSSHQQNYSALPVLYRFQARQVEIDHRVKSIAYVPHVKSTDTHHVRLYGDVHILNAAGKVVRKPESNGIRPCNITVAAINHYFTKSYEEFEKKRQRGLAGHSERNSIYQGEQGKLHIRSEYCHHQREASEIDSFAWDWYRAKKSEQLGYAYGADFPVQNFTAALVLTEASDCRVAPTVVVSTKPTRVHKGPVASTITNPRNRVGG